MNVTDNSGSSASIGMIFVVIEIALYIDVRSFNFVPVVLLTLVNAVFFFEDLLGASDSANSIKEAFAVVVV